MANFGNNLKNWMDTEWKNDDEKAMKIFEKEWKKATKKLVESTPEGQIRFDLVNRYKIIKKLQLNPFFFKSTHFIRDAINEASRTKPFFSVCPSDLYFPNLTFPNEQYLDQYMLVFYANNIEKNANVASTLIEFWFETQVLPDFERATKKRKLDSTATLDKSELYLYREIKNCLDHFDIQFTKDQYKENFMQLCDKNGIKLKNFSYCPQKVSGTDSFEISL